MAKGDVHGTISCPYGCDRILEVKETAQARKLHYYCPDCGAQGFPPAERFDELQEASGGERDEGDDGGDDGKRRGPLGSIFGR